MVERLDVDSVWHQIIVSDPAGLSGTSVVAFVKPIIQTLGVTAVVISDLVGACPGLKDYEGVAVSSDEFLQRAADATQYDWAFFFLYSNIPTPAEINVIDERTRMLNADATVRLADDYYFYVYSRDQKLMSDLQRAHPSAEYKAVRLLELDIPY